MFEFIRNIIPRIQQFSGQLSHIESFVDKPWVLFDADQNTHEYLFLRDHRLLLSLNGIVKEGRWELLPTGKLLVNRVTDQILLQHKFIDEGILLLMISGGNELPFMLMNESIITDRDPVRYLREVEATRLNYTFYQTVDGILLNDSNSNTSNFQIGSEIRYDNGNKVHGILTMPSEKDMEVFVNEGIVEAVYYLCKYETIYNVPLIVKSKQKRTIAVGDQISNHTELPYRVHKNIFPNSEYYLIHTDENGKVIKVKVTNNIILMVTLFFTAIMIVYFLIKIMKEDF
jgi:hypothetical protein